jgi:hypothetical protein
VDRYPKCGCPDAPSSGNGDDNHERSGERTLDISELDRKCEQVGDEDLDRVRRCRGRDKPIFVAEHKHISARRQRWYHAQDVAWALAARHKQCVLALKVQWCLPPGSEGKALRVLYRTSEDSEAEFGPSEDGWFTECEYHRFLDDLRKKYHDPECGCR